jgi:endonuclease/exonuclease/phosphatase family metal-dependent hydrolase
MPALLSFVLASILACPTTDSPPEPADLQLTAMTFNVLCSFCGGSEYDPWEERLGYFDDIFQRHDPDLIGVQELTFATEVDALLERLPGFDAVYFTDDQAGPYGLSDYPDATLFYRTERFGLVESGFYWLSPTPDDSWSTGFADDAQLPRLVVWARLHAATEMRDLLFVTTHFDNNPPSQDLSAPLLLERTEPWVAELPVVVTGDFNSQTYDPAYHVLVEGVGGSGFSLVNAQDLADAWSQDTNLEPAPDYDLDGRIDHIFVADGPTSSWTSSNWVVDQNVYGDLDRYPSDHWAIAADMLSRR